jgi:hypothetical protein
VVAGGTVLTAKPKSEIVISQGRVNGRPPEREG